jgi:hypothetical protein
MVRVAIGRNWIRKRNCLDGSLGNAERRSAATKACQALAGVAPINPRCSL